MSLEYICEMCFREGEEIGLIGSGIVLFEHKGRYGLIRTNDAHRDLEIFYFPERPVVDPDPDCENELSEEWVDKCDRLREALKLDPEDGHCLVTNAIEAGWNTDRQKECGYDGSFFHCWLMQYCGKMIDEYVKQRTT